MNLLETIGLIHIVFYSCYGLVSIVKQLLKNKTIEVKDGFKVYQTRDVHSN